jgi:hypothetical protein
VNEPLVGFAVAGASVPNAKRPTTTISPSVRILMGSPRYPSVIRDCLWNGFGNTRVATSQTAELKTAIARLQTFRSS